MHISQALSNELESASVAEVQGGGIERVSAIESKGASRQTYLFEVVYTLDPRRPIAGPVVGRENQRRPAPDRDAILWHTRCPQHSATPFDESRFTRLMYRTTLEGEPPVMAEPAAAA